jgi:hypothetical protein
MLLEVTWTEFKSYIQDTNLKWLYVLESNGTNYSVYLSYQGFILKSYLRNGTNDYTDFNDNWKSLGNTKITHTDSSGTEVVVAKVEPFANKVLPDGKKLYKRIHGMAKQTISASGSHEFDFVVPYPHVKMTAVEIIGSNGDCTATLKVTDDDSGTYSTIPNYLLNQFGFDANVPKDFYRSQSQFDADLYYGMHLLVNISNNNASSVDVSINIELDEVKA